ncbi:hypothetical protein SAICODRAFT_70322 [Saitoella complicata NRRL Y-17804]|nr:uncharacterized protein SAICODRAFT_70322 [Saitoella complicata NRRL Y-17804]ODQ54071.1 hypothetical protein SAICODRAFT_70322 [Saitoella complicata NRRL Y-17804]
MTCRRTIQRVCARTLLAPSPTLARPFASTVPSHKAPHPLRIRQNFDVNDDIEVVQAQIKKLTGETLPDAVAWQAVTHKSFAHGKEGYNDKLAFMGRRVLKFHLALQLASRESSRPSAINNKAIESVTSARLDNATKASTLFSVAQNMGLNIQDVMRWKPKQTGDLELSGVKGVVGDCLTAMIGAVFMTKGGQAAEELVVKKVLPHIIGVGNPRQSSRKQVEA